jgi:uncharacterized protein YqiB (DUF1249 family)
MQMMKKNAYLTTTPVGLYESNYRRLNRLFDDLSIFSVGDIITLQHSEIRLQILEQHKYTTVIHFQQNLQTHFKQLNAIEMELRICHDASLTEVVGYQGQSPVQSALVYPNRHMLQVDEKKQLNLLLKDILENAIKSERRKNHTTSPCN